MAVNFQTLNNGIKALIAFLMLLVLVAPAIARGPVSFAPLAAELQSAVVNISTTRTYGSNGQGMPFPDVPESSPFREFFDQFRQYSPNEDFEHDEPMEARSLGSGFVIDPKGIIVTNYHVIEGANEIFVAFVDGKRLEATVMGADARMDLAVLKVDAGRDLDYVSFGDSDQALVGDWVMAIGNPFGLGGSVSAGIVSARNRDIRSGPYDNFIQTDAAINQGNSGGPLFNMDGEVVGINTAIYSQSGGSLGIGFSIPVNLARPFIEQLIEFGETRRGWLGVQIQEVTEDIAAGLERDDTSGALVTGVEPEGPSANIILEGDLIIEFDGKAVTKMRDLPRLVAETLVGKEVIVRVLRLGEEMDLTVTLGRLEQINPFDDIDKLPPADVPVDNSGSLGIEVEEMSDDLRIKYAIRLSVEGVVITDVEAQSDADAKGLRPGYTITEVNQQIINSKRDFDTIVATALEVGREVILLKIVDPTGAPRFVGLRLQK
jgi:serine protease Do